MLPIINTYNNKLSKHLYSSHPLDCMFFSTRFAVNCLMSLHILHETLGIVHGDISSNNIMFSTEDDCWKIIDFDQSIGISQSLGLSRKAGTEGFIAPESQQSGIFTFKSDIFSLGKVIVDYLNSLLIHQILLDETGEVDANLRSMFNAFNRISLSMIATDPEMRPSAIEALDKMFDIFQCFAYDYENPGYIAIKNILSGKIQNDLKEKTDQLSLTKKLKMNESEEKEQKNLALSITIEKNIK